MIAAMESIKTIILRADKFNRRTVVVHHDGVEVDRHSFDVNDADKRIAFAESIIKKLRSSSRLPTAAECVHWNPQSGIPQEFTEEGKLAEQILRELATVEETERREAEEARRVSPSQKTVDAMLDRALPHSLEAEKSVLGSLLLDTRLIDDVSLVLRPDDFYSPAHRKVYGHLVAMHDGGEPIDTTLLIARMKSVCEFETSGGMSLLQELIESVPTASYAVHYAKIVAEKSKAREMIAAGTSLLRSAYDGATSEELRVQAECLLQFDDRAGEAVSLDVAVADAMDVLSDRIKNGLPTGLELPFPDAQRKIGGLRAGELIVAAGRPGMGKTSFALNIVRSIAKVAAVLFVSLEMSRRELCERLLSAESAVDGEHIREGRLDSDERRAVIEAQSDLHGLPVTIDDNPRRTIADIAAQSRRAKRRGTLGLIVIDYLSLIEPENPRDPRHEQVAKMARRLKMLARELQVPVVVLAQLNREVEKGNDHRPRLSHLRESGAVEQDADVVLFVHREEVYKPDDVDLRGKAELIVAKNRNGATGIVPLTWNPETTSFLSAARGEEWKY